MAITSIGTRGTQVSSAAGTTVARAPTATVAVGRVLVCQVAQNGNASVSVADAAGNTWVNLGSGSNSSGTARSDIWITTVDTQLTTGTNVTVTFGSSVTHKSMALWEFSVEAGNTLVPSAAEVANESTGNGFGSVSFSGLSSQQRLYLRALAKQANSTTAITVTSGFTTQALTLRSQNNASAIAQRGEFRINTSTGETSNPTMAVSGNTGNVFVALEEEAPSTTVVGNDLDGAYSLNAAVGTNGAGSYAVMAAVGANASGSYGLLAVVGQSQDASYAALQAATQALDGAYAAQAHVSGALDDGYALTAAVGQVLSGAYDVGAVTAVGNDLDGTYGVLLAASAVVAGEYAVVAAVAAQQAGAYGLLAGVGADQAGAYAIEAAGVVGAELAGGYELTAAVASTVPGGYQVQALVGTGLEGAFSLLTSTAADLVQAYAALELVAASLAGGYALDSTTVPTVRAPSGNGYQRPQAAQNRIPLLQGGTRPAQRLATSRPGRT